MTRENSEDVIYPKDILMPSAVLLGFVIAALAVLSSNLAQAPTNEKVQLMIIIRNFTVGSLGTVVSIIVAIITAVASSIKRSAKLAQVSIIAFGVSWIVAGAVIMLALVGNAFGIQSLQIQFSEFANFAYTVYFVAISTITLVYLRGIYRIHVLHTVRKEILAAGIAIITYFTLELNALTMWLPLPIEIARTLADISGGIVIVIVMILILRIEAMRKKSMGNSRNQ